MPVAKNRTFTNGRDALFVRCSIDYNLAFSNNKWSFQMYGIFVAKCRQCGRQFTVAPNTDLSQAVCPECKVKPEPTKEEEEKEEQQDSDRNLPGNRGSPKSKQTGWLARIPFISNK